MQYTHIHALHIRSRTESRDRVMSLSNGSGFYTVVPVAFFTNGVFIVTRPGFELTTPASWLTSKDDVLINRFTLEGCKFKQQNRASRKGDGVAIISRESMRMSVKNQEITEPMEDIDAYVTYENKSLESIRSAKDDLLLQIKRPHLVTAGDRSFFHVLE